jgi:hypothetical protein
MMASTLLFWASATTAPPPGAGFDPHHVGGEGPSFYPTEMDAPPPGSGFDPPHMGDIPVQARPRHLTAVQVASWDGLKDAIDNIASGSSGTFALATGFNCGYNGEITVTGNVTVRGYGAVCDAAQGGRFFSVNSGAQLALDAMTLKNGRTDYVSH